MGYVVNKRRFKQSGLPFLLPYSNKSKVITYLTVDNFNGSDSTTWGDEYSRPMTRGTYGSWQLAADGKSVHIDPGYANKSALKVFAPNNLYNFTVYIVAQYSGTDVYFRADTPSPIHSANIFYDTTQYSSKNLGSNFSAWGTAGNYRYFSASALDSFQTYALSFQRNNKPIHVLNSSKPTFPYNGGNYPNSFYYYNATSSHHEAYIKLLAIVSEAESDTVLQNNVDFIRNQLHLT